MEEMLKKILDGQRQLFEEIAGLKDGQRQLVAENQEIRKDIAKLNDKLVVLDGKLDENIQFTKALMHSSEVSGAKLEGLTLTVAKVQGDVAGIREDIALVEKVTAKNWSDISGLKMAK